MAFMYEWKGDFDSEAVEALHAEGFGHVPQDHDWRAQVEKHSLGWVCAKDGAELIGFVNVAWDGAGHAFVMDTLVASRARRKGVGQRLIEISVERARAAGCEWLHVDFDEHLRSFYLDACGFAEVDAGLIDLRAPSGGDSPA